MQTPDKFTLNQPTANHHKMTLRSQTNISPPPHYLILPDDNAMPYSLPHHHPTSKPHIISPDYQTSYVNTASNFKQSALDQIIANHIFYSPTVIIFSMKLAVNARLWTHYYREAMVLTGPNHYAMNGTDLQTDG